MPGGESNNANGSSTSSWLNCPQLLMYIRIIPYLLMFARRSQMFSILLGDEMRDDELGDDSSVPAVPSGLAMKKALTRFVFALMLSQSVCALQVHLLLCIVNSSGKMHGSKVWYAQRCIGSAHPLFCSPTTV